MNTFGIFPSQQYLVKSGCLVACNAMSHRDSVVGYEFQISESYNQRWFLWCDSGFKKSITNVDSKKFDGRCFSNCG